ncbi:MAG: fucose isomerase, partial [Acidobacteria bacterium]|nr:fucose isomerase [Acidobacteriota bacterium]
MNPQTFGIIVGNRGFFPDHLAKSGREEIINVLQAAGYGVVILSPDDTKYGAVETRAEAKKCAALFDKHRHEIDGVIVTLPNFGDERGIAEALRGSGLNVPVLIQATPDRAGSMTIADRRDSFCGKMSACNNLKQYGIPYSLTTLHTEALDSPEFASDLAQFAAVCRVVKGLRNCRVGAIGARPTAFNTVRYSEKLFEGSGIDVDTIDLSEIFGRISRLADDHPAVAAKLAEIKAYVSTQGIADAALVKMSKLGVVIDTWTR